MSRAFYKNTSKLLFGNASGQAIGIIAIPIITRLFDVEVFGEFSVLVASALILSTISTLSLHLAVLIPKSDYEAKKMVSLSLYVCMFFSTITAAVVIIAPEFINKIIGSTSNGSTLYIIPLLVFFQGIYIVLTYWGVRTKNFNKVSGSKVIEGLVDRGSAIFIGMLGYVSIWSLTLARLFSNLASILIIFPTLWHSKEVSKAQRSTSYIYLLRKYKRYVFFNTPSMLLINAGLQLPIVLLAFFFGPAAAGVYAMANRIVNIPVNAFGNAFSKTYTQKIASDLNENNLELIKRDTEKYFVKLFSFLLIPFSALVVVGEPFFSLLLGEDWAKAGTLSAVLSYMAMTTLLAQGFGGLFDVFEKQQIRLIYHSINFLVRVGSLFIGYNLGFSLVETVLLFAATSTAMNIVALFLLFTCINRAVILWRAIQKNTIYVFLFYSFVLASHVLEIGIFAMSTITGLLVILWFHALGGVNNLKLLMVKKQVS